MRLTIVPSGPQQRASRRSSATESRAVGGVFLVVLGLVVLATGASVLATAALWLVGFVPFIGLTVLPLQLVAWVLRGLVFQFIALASVGAYLKIYRTESTETVGTSQGLSPCILVRTLGPPVNSGQWRCVEFHDRLHEISVSHRTPAD